MSEPLSMGRLVKIAGAGKVGVAALVGMLGRGDAVRQACEIQTAEMHLRMVVREAELPAALAEVDRRAAIYVSVSYPHPVTGLPEWYGEPMGRLSALREVYQDIVAGEWRP